MSTTLNKELEAAFLERNETLRGFYEAGATKLTEEEVASLTPILNDLKSNTERYQEVDKIAEGGEKIISLVHDHRLDRRVALARASRAHTLQDQERFLREARLTANLEHPNIASVHNMGVDSEGVPFFTMSLIKGDSLKDIIRQLSNGNKDYQKLYGLEDLLNIFLKICDAITYAHSRNVLHLDIKPDNIKVGEFGEVFVCDWGLARILNNPDDATHIDEGLDGDILNDMTLSGTIKGTPGFMAPEQTIAYGERSPRTDVYSLGAVLYMLLTLKLPVHGNSANDVMEQTREGKIIPPHRRSQDRRLPSGLVAITMKALSLKPEDRYDNVRELKSDINRHLSGRATTAENASVMTVFSRLIQRHSRMTSIILAFFIALAILISMNLVSVAKDRTTNLNERLRAERNFELYKQQQQVAKKLGDDLGEAVLYTVKSRDFINAPSMIQVLERGMTEKLDDIDKKNLLHQKGTLHFVLQQFNAAIVCFEMAGAEKKNAQILQLCRKYAEIKPHDNSRLTDRQLADLINEPRTGSSIQTLYYMYYHHLNRRIPINPEDYIYLAGAMLDRLNNSNGAKNGRLKLIGTEKGYHLDLSNTDYSIFTLNVIGVYRRNVLAPLKLYSLDISNTPIQDISELRGLNLNELRITGVSKPFSQQKIFNHLNQFEVKKLIISEGACPPNILRTLRQKQQYKVTTVPKAK